MFDSMVRIAVNVVTTPITVAADVATLGGALSDREEPYTVTKVKETIKEVEKLAEPF